MTIRQWDRREELRGELLDLIVEMMALGRTAEGQNTPEFRRLDQELTEKNAELEALNALSRKVCAAPVSAAELHEALCAIDEKRPSALRSYLGSVLTALGFTLFLGGGIADALFAGAVGAMVCWMQRKVMPVFRNGAFFQLLTGLLAGAVICLAGRLSDVFAVDKMSIGVIMLLIPGAALTNAVRDMLVGHTISGLLRLAESLLLALMLAIGFGSAIYLFGA